MDEPLASLPTPLANPTVSVEPAGGKRKVTVIIAAIIAVVLIGTAAAFAYLADPLGIFASPQKIIASAIANLADATSLEYDLALHAQSTGDKNPGTDVTLTAQGTSDTFDLEHPKSSFAFSVTATGALPTPEPISFAFETRTVDKIIYLRVADLSFLTGILGPSFTPGPLQNQWIKIDPEALRKQFAATFNQSNPETADPFAGIQKSQQAAAEEFKLKAEQTKTALKAAHLFGNIERLPAETVGEVSANHYRAAIDINGVADFVVAAKNIWTPDQPLTDQEINDMKSTLLESPPPPIDLWIAKRDKTFAKIHAEVPITGNMPGTVDATVLFKNFNKPVNIEVPSPSTPIEEVLGSLFASFSTGSQQAASGGALEAPPVLTPGPLDADGDGLSDSSETQLFVNTDPKKADTDGDGLTDKQELMTYGTNPLKKDTDGDGYSDLEEIKNGYNPLGPGKLKP